MLWRIKRAQKVTDTQNYIFIHKIIHYTQKYLCTLVGVNLAWMYIKVWRYTRVCALDAFCKYRMVALIATVVVCSCGGRTPVHLCILCQHLFITHAEVSE